MPVIVPATVAAMLLSGGSSAASPPVIEAGLMDRQGAIAPASISSIDMGTTGRAGEIRILEARGAERARPMAEVLAIVPRWWADGSAADPAGSPALAAAGSGWVELTDGQRLVGRPGSVAAAGERLTWATERFGDVELDLERIARIVVQPHAVTPAAMMAVTKSDTLWLANGDRLEGFVDSVRPAAEGAEAGMVFMIDIGGASSAVPVNQVIQARLANPPVAAGGPTAWLSDGSILRLAAASTDASRSGILVRAEVSGTGDSAKAGVLLAPGELTALAPDPRRFAPLASLALSSHRPIGLMRRAGPMVAILDDHPDPLGAADVIIPGPMTVEWLLPEGVTRLVGAARLDEPDWAWGECTLIVELVPDGAPSGEPARQVARAKLGGSAVRAALAFDLPATRPGERLRMRVDPGELGPIRDRVRLERVLLIRGGPQS